jgi:hypothetical protein
MSSSIAESANFISSNGLIGYLAIRIVLYGSSVIECKQMSVNTSYIVSSGPTLITRGSPSPSRVTSPPQIRTGKIPPQALAKDLDSLSNNINQLHGVLSSVSQAIEHLTLQDQQGNTVGILGSEVYHGQYIQNWFSTILIGGNPLMPDFAVDTSGNLILNNATITIVATNGSSLVIQTNPPAMIVKDHTGATVASIGVDSSGNGVVTFAVPPTISGTFTGTATVRNAAGTGVSTFVFSNGICTSYIP